tara:strand:+ start:190 stop:516 length:327 start_codon:yes stop_codon:yes gene_type:complete
MAATWKVESLTSTNTIGSLSNVVTTVHWCVSDSETVGSEEYTGNVYGASALAEPDSSSYIDYDSITESQAITWAKDVLTSDEITSAELGVSVQIAEKKAPLTKNGVPW